MNILKIDKGILVISLLLLGIGVVFVYSSSFALAEEKYSGSNFYLMRHIIRVFFALIFFVCFIHIDYHFISKFSNIGYVLSIILLVYILALPDSEAVKGAKRWLSIGFLKFQVSEFARIVLVVYLAVKLEGFKERIKEGNVFIQNIIKIGIICVLIFAEPDFSTAVMTGCVGLALIFVAGAKIKHIAGLLICVIPFVILVVTRSAYKLQRLKGFLQSGEMKDGASYQVYQSLLGLGHGGLLGKGVGKGVQKYFFLPEPHTDFVFSILGEEIGFIGLFLIFILFSILLYRGMRIALRASDRLGQIMAFGFTFMLGLYVIVHAFVNTALAPTTGVPLPLLSYGGMNLIFTMSSLGILLNISGQSRNMDVLLKERKRL